MSEPQPSDARGVKLGLWDTTSLIVGIIVGVGIYFTPPVIFGALPDGATAIAVWVAGGLLCMIGALCFAELAATYPRSGGEYVYLSRAYGGWLGFLFAWAQLAVIRPGATVAVIAYPFAWYTGALLGVPDDNRLFFVLVASGVIVALTAINVVGVRVGKTTQNTLTLLKVLAVAGILAAGLLYGSEPVFAAPGPSAPPPGTEAWLNGMTLAFILVLWTYSGWHEAAYVVAEVQEQRRTIPAALLLGTASVMVIYLLINLAYLRGLGFAAAGGSKAIAADTLGLIFGAAGVKAMAGLVMLSCLGALNGAIFTGSRVFTEVGRDHPLFSRLSVWHAGLGTPVVALVVQGVLGVAFAVVVGLLVGGAEPFQTLINCTAAVFWLFFLLTGASQFLLRWKDPGIERPFRTPGYPVTPLIFCGFSAFMMYRSILYKPELSLIGVGLLLAGVPLYFVSQAMRRR